MCHPVYSNICPTSDPREDQLSCFAISTNVGKYQRERTLKQRLISCGTLATMRTIEIHSYLNISSQTMGIFRFCSRTYFPSRSTWSRNMVLPSWYLTDRKNCN